MQKNDGLSALAYAYNIAGKMERADYEFYIEDELFESEEELGKLLWIIVRQARQQEMNPENALKKEIVQQEKIFHEWEKTIDH